MALCNKCGSVKSPVNDHPECFRCCGCSWPKHKCASCRRWTKDQWEQVFRDELDRKRFKNECRADRRSESSAPPSAAQETSARVKMGISSTAGPSLNRPIRSLDKDRIAGQGVRGSTSPREEHTSKVRADRHPSAGQGVRGSASPRGEHTFDVRASPRSTSTYACGRQFQQGNSSFSSAHASYQQAFYPQTETREMIGRSAVESRQSGDKAETIRTQEFKNAVSIIFKTLPADRCPRRAQIKEEEPHECLPRLSAVDRTSVLQSQTDLLPTSRTVVSLAKAFDTIVGNLELNDFLSENNMSSFGFTPQHYETFPGEFSFDPPRLDSNLDVLISQLSERRRSASANPSAPRWDRNTEVLVRRALAVNSFIDLGVEAVHELAKDSSNKNKPKRLTDIADLTKVLSRASMHLMALNMATAINFTLRNSVYDIPQKEHQSLRSAPCRSSEQYVAETQKTRQAASGTQTRAAPEDRQHNRFNPYQRPMGKAMWKPAK